MTRVPDVRILVIADDLTGAVDSAATIWLKGPRLCVPWHDGEDDWDRADALRPTVLSISTDSRVLDPKQAAERVSRAVDWARNRGFRLVKKVDSLLRGNVAAEVAAFLDAVDASAAVFAPALPSQGRITIAGTQLVDGVPVSSSPAGLDPHAPARQSYISALLPAGVRSYPLRINAVREYDLERLVKGAAGGVIVADAAEQQDLDRLRAAALAVPDVVMIGSSGLIAGSEPAQPAMLDGRILVVSASRRPEVAEQCASLVQAVPTAFEVVVDPARISSGTTDPGRWLAGSDKARISVVRVDPDAPLASSAVERRADSAALLSALALCVTEEVGRTADAGSTPLTVVVLGGDLGSAICETLDARVLDVSAVACGGGGLCRVVESGGRHDPEGVRPDRVRMVLRSGAFGGRDALIDALVL